MSRRTKARVARLYNECNAAAFGVCTIDSELTDESGKQDIGVVLDDFVIVVVAVGIEGAR